MNLPTDTIFAIAANLISLIDRALPSDTERLARFEQRYPVRFERIKKKALEEKLRQLRKLHRFCVKHGIEPAALVKYTGGELHTIDILNQMKKD
jgi:hypothetical protein